MQLVIWLLFKKVRVFNCGALVEPCTRAYGGPLGTRMFRRKTHSFCEIKVAFFNNSAFLNKCAVFP